MKRLLLRLFGIHICHNCRSLTDRLYPSYFRSLVDDVCYGCFCDAFEKWDGTT